MTVYGTKIISDIDFPLDLSHETETRYEIELSSNVPFLLENSIICGFHLFYAHNRDVFLYGDRDLERNEPGQIWKYEVKEIASFFWVAGKKTIYYKLEASATLEHLGFWFIHMVLPFYLALEKKYDFLHAGSVEVKGKPIVFIAPSMGGKSTMTDYFISQGHPLITDDKLPVSIENGKFMVINSHPYHRPYRGFETLGKRVENISSDFKEIHAFYILEKDEQDAPIIIEEINGFVKFNVLALNYLFPMAHSDKEQLLFMSKMLNDIKVFSVKIPWDKHFLNKVYESIVVHSKGI